MIWHNIGYILGSYGMLDDLLMGTADPYHVALNAYLHSVPIWTDQVDNVAVSVRKVVNWTEAQELYMTGGDATTGAQSQVQILSTSTLPTHVQVTVYFANGNTFTRDVDLGPADMLTLPIADAGRFSGVFGLQVKADELVAAQVAVARRNKQGLTLAPSTQLSTQWYLAEGYTGQTFKETLSILNPDSTHPATVALHLYTSDGAIRTTQIAVPAHSTQQVNVNKLLPRQSIGISAVSDRPVAMSRTLTFGKNSYGVTTSAGIDTLSSCWDFKGITKRNGLQSFLTIVNPQATPARASLLISGNTERAVTMKVAAQGRVTVNLNLYGWASQGTLRLTSSLPVAAELPEYFGQPNSKNAAAPSLLVGASCAHTSTASH